MTAGIILWRGHGRTGALCLSGGAVAVAGQGLGRAPSAGRGPSGIGGGGACGRGYRVRRSSGAIAVIGGGTREAQCWSCQATRCGSVIDITVNAYATYAAVILLSCSCYSRRLNPRNDRIGCTFIGILQPSQCSRVKGFVDVLISLGTDAGILAPLGGIFAIQDERHNSFVGSST
ncbi:hypothetical protein B0H13DRAFT_1893884 [Mycena leptocephala]|nr:hypothetical protein B0H13DRAFT_1893884 [Mycena leptocephala]